MDFGLIPKQTGPFEEVWAECRTAEELGYAAIFTTEHHAQEVDKDVHHWPAQLTRLSAIAARTTDVELGTGVIVLPLHHALGVAEQCAVIDQLSDGRLTIGVGLGYVPAEFDAFGVALDDRPGRLVEGLRLLDAYLSADGEPISMDGRYYSLDEWVPAPETVQDPRPPLLNGGWGTLAMQRSVTLCDGWIAGFTADHAQLRERYDSLRKVARDHGVDWESMPRPVEREVVIARTDEEAMELGEKHLYRGYAREHGSEDWSHPLLDEDDMTDFPSLARDRFLVGSPETIADQVEALRRETDATRIVCRFHHLGMDHAAVHRQIRLFGNHVIPAVE